MAAATLAALLGALSAHAALANPTIHMAPQGVEYMSGGNGAAEAAFMQMVSPRWAATLELGVNAGSGNGSGGGKPGARPGGFPAAAHIVVHNTYNGDLALDVTSAGPVVLARLDPGVYDVDVTLGDLTQTQSITVAVDAPARARFLWPSNFDMAAVRPDASRQTAMLSARP